MVFTKQLHRLIAYLGELLFTGLRAYYRAYGVKVGKGCVSVLNLILFIRLITGNETCGHDEDK